MRVLACLALVLTVLAGSVATASAEEARLSFDAEQGAWPVGGRSGVWEPVDVWEYEGIVKIDGEVDNGFDYIRIELNDKDLRPLTTGTYTEVRNRLQHPEGPGILVISNGFGCGEDLATFTIERIERSGGQLTGLDATVEQRCGDRVGPAFRARVHYAA